MRVSTMGMLCLVFVLPALSAQAQAHSGEDKRIELLCAFHRYMQQAPEKGTDKKRLQSYIHVSDSAWLEGSRQNRILRAALENLSRTLQGTDLTRYGAVPWRRFPRQDSLPRMAWEAEPITHMLGQPVPADRERELQEGRQQVENILVLFRRDKPDEPSDYVLFDAATGKISSWVLVNQGGLHYFLML